MADTHNEYFEVALQYSRELTLEEADQAAKDIAAALHIYGLVYLAPSMDIEVKLLRVKRN